MSYSVWISVLLNSFAATAIACILPRLSPNLPVIGKERGLGWAIAMGVGLVFLSGWMLFGVEDSVESPMHGLLLSTLAVSGIALKWLLTIVASHGRALHERSLLQSLLFSPLGLLCYGRALAGAEFPMLALCWFAHGFVWQAIFGDASRILLKGQ